MSTITTEQQQAIPDCMSLVIGRWIIDLQDSMPHSILNSAEWKRLLPLAAGTGRDPERETARLHIIMNWMWDTVLPTVQPIADANGIGHEWRTMIQQRIRRAVAEAANAAWMAEVAWAASAAEGVVEMFDAMGLRAAAEVAEVAACVACEVAEWAARAAVDAKWTWRQPRTWATQDAVEEAAAEAAWTAFNPCGLLAQLVAI